MITANAQSDVRERSLIYWYVGLTSFVMATLALLALMVIPAPVSGNAGDGFGYFAFIVMPLFGGSFVMGIIALVFLVVWSKAVTRPVGNLMMGAWWILVSLSGILLVGEIAMAIYFSALAGIIV